jgi:hypothetical protein
MERSNNSPISDRFHFYYTKRKIYLAALKGLIVIAFFAFIFRASLSDWKLEAPLSRIPSAELGLWLLFMAIPLWWFIYRPLRQLSKLSIPVVTMSRDGIALKGRAPIPWHTITKSELISMGYGGIAVYSLIRIWTSSATLPKTILSDTLGICRDEYDKQYRIYSKLA